MVITRLFKRLIKNHPEEKLLICMESTGYYNWPSYRVFDNLNLELYVINPLHLKRSLGLVRGKNNLIDAERIAKFLKLHLENLHPFIFTRKVIKKYKL
ncbi:transposase [Lutibacter sp.]|uniref:IS110 family transposase n=1 Tax=Lutibacter sp. TaxID=1925666 RepID=UPI0025BB8B20|nr:transposase [Lutibacter sp.]MCF6180601.1 transposase [Lutibacter sp.]